MVAFAAGSHTFHHSGVGAYDAEEFYAVHVELEHRSADVLHLFGGEALVSRLRTGGPPHNEQRGYKHKRRYGRPKRYAHAHGTAYGCYSARSHIHSAASRAETQRMATIAETDAVAVAEAGHNGHFESVHFGQFAAA